MAAHISQGTWHQPLVIAEGDTHPFCPPSLRKTTPWSSGPSFLGAEYSHGVRCPPKTQTGPARLCQQVHCVTPNRPNLGSEGRSGSQTEPGTAFTILSGGAPALRAP